LLYTCTAGIILFLLKKHKPALFTGLAALCLLMLCLCKDQWFLLQQNHLVAYNTAKANYIELIKGNRYSVVSPYIGKIKRTEYAATAAHTGWQVWRKDTGPTNEILNIGGKTALVLNADMTGGGHFHVDYLIVNYTAKLNLTKLREVFSPNLIVIGNNFTRKQQDKYVKKSEAAGIKIHAIANDGAFVLH
jgi:hypothetical protein